MRSLTESQRIFICFFVFGLLNNILYVIILSAAIDLVGSATPKAVVLLADILPALTIKLIAPFFIHLIPYISRIWTLVGLSTTGMILISLSSSGSIGTKLFGIILASLSCGLGELSFLQLTHYYDERQSIGGFSTGTGGAGLFGSFLFMLLTNVMGIPVWIVLLMFAIVPSGFAGIYFYYLPEQGQGIEYEEIVQELTDDEEDEIVIEMNSKYNVQYMITHIWTTINEIKPLVIPYMIPLMTVYFSEYLINQGISPTLLFPLEELPRWLFSSYRDIYVVYGFLYQLGVFISRSSISFGIRVRHLGKLSILQFINVLITLCQSLYDLPFGNIWLMVILIFFEGLLGGLSYVNTFVSVSEQVPKSKREFSMGCVSISDGIGIVLAGCVSLWLERALCRQQVSRDRDWCLTGGSL
ncbi:BTN1 [[Candida] subhashii]|uniref:Protein BTN1 n=1 Tax=[Candida] subhashii TaxID=561895 RepID=A0A8J5UUV6_9ASCO|nr:BTN1 [[Candida] subhashii]KAG7660724.1 BTN1 [[Candida] subhashii]